MNFFLWPVFDFVAKNRWAQITLAIITGWFLIWLYLKIRDDGVRKQARAEQERRSLEEQARVAETRREITQENTDAVTRADEAVADLPRYRHTDELRNNDPNLATIVLGNGAGRGQGTEGY